MNRRSLCWALAGLAGLLALGGWMIARHAPAPPEPPDLAPTELKTLARVSQTQPRAALEALATRWSDHAHLLQVHLVQRTPRGPLVLANYDEDSDDPQATHWLLPWPGVTEKLAQPLTSPCLAESQYLGTTYRHRLLPLDAAGSHVLVLTTTAPPRSASPPLAIACWAASLFALVMALGVSRAGGEG